MSPSDEIFAAKTTNLEYILSHILHKNSTERVARPMIVIRL
jgi:hypothetical protein